ncbi:bifunctional diguanylate cyclase/phosphodiesterase [Massilia glaciei]|uniref:Bifunctional diguanylate cyclase/phosphodiesterase n=1 Tax=Massilia glaciei TaxID=1524097 RepID=A0A2U2HMX7_9BURK|nr:bifunctional diguanylate cyclase/phosphodiesterase [Massilia glaciei]PWF48860.1 bifunctional diguanylate cyclase/phosphodiesterase [Massilia glaciei]
MHGRQGRLLQRGDLAQRKDGSLFWAHIALTALHNEAGALLGFSKITLDLTRHRQLEECKKEKEEIDFILSAAESGTWKCHFENDQVEVSHHLLALLGQKGRDPNFTLDGWQALVHEDDRGAVRQRLEQARSRTDGAPFELELRLLGANGASRWFFMRANWHFDADDKPLVFMGVCVDIDSVKQAEAEQQRLFRKLEQERLRFANILEQMPSGIVLAEAPSGKLTYQNRAAEAMLGRGIGAVKSYHDYGLYQLYDVHGVRIKAEDLPLARTLITQERSNDQELSYKRRDGSEAHIAVTTAPIDDDDGVVRVAVAAVHDVSSLKNGGLSAASERERAEVTLAAVTDGVLATDRHGKVTSVNPAAQRLLGLSEAEALGRPLGEVVHYAESVGAASVFGAIGLCLEQRRTITNLPHATLVGRDEQRYSVENAVAPVVLADGELIGTVLVLHDVTESKRLLRRLGFEASHDALTGLINRREFEIRLLRTIERARHAGSADAALLYLDLDQFKIVNDTCGHAAGDDLLKQLAQSYVEHVRERDTLARIGGDEFALIVEHCTLDEALAVADQILDATRGFRYNCKGRVFQIGVSIGLTPIDLATASVEDSLRRADHACCIAKERGRNQVYVHHQGDPDFAQRRSDMHWVTRLSHAFQHDRLLLYCQPIMALCDASSALHYEILLRLKDGRGGPIAPGTFLPAAERYDVIHKIDLWVLTKTLEWLAGQPEHLKELEMCSINLSRRSLADPGFHKVAAGMVDGSGVPADKLCFEITENGAIADMKKTIAFIDTLTARGCRFSLDDFGTGMTSFSYLQQLPVDFIKIDGSLIQMMSSSAVDYEMVRFANDISDMMGRKTIAEYVTDPAISASLTEIGVDFAQGYWVGKPRPLHA